MNTEYIEAVSNYFKNKTDYMFHLSDEHTMLFMNTLIEDCNHMRIYLSDSIETNLIFTNQEFLLKLNKYLYRDNFYLDVITNLENKGENIPPLNGLIVLGHHPAYQEGRLNIYDGKNVQIDGPNDIIMTQAILCDYEKYYYTFKQNEVKYSIANFNDIKHTTSLVVRFDDIKLTLKDIFEK